MVDDTKTLWTQTEGNENRTTLLELSIHIIEEQGKATFRQLDQIPCMIAAVLKFLTVFRQFLRLKSKANLPQKEPQDLSAKGLRQTSVQAGITGSAAVQSCNLFPAAALPVATTCLRTILQQ